MGLVLVTPQIVNPRCVDPLRGHELLAGTLADGRMADAILCDPVLKVTEDDLAGMPKLGAIAVAGSGLDNIDQPAAQARGVQLFTAAEAVVEATADIAFGLLIAACRQMWDAGVHLRQGRWDGWTFADSYGREVSGSVLGLVGFGLIGQAVARRAEGFGMTVLHHTRHDTGIEGWIPDLDELLIESDVVSLHLPLTAESTGIIDRRRIGLLGPADVIVNTSRGALIDEEALADQLESGGLLAAGLDVFANEPAISPRLLAAPRTVLLPHVGTATRATREAMLCVAARRLAEHLDQRGSSRRSHE
jgi:glyoxylate reductase